MELMLKFPCNNDEIKAEVGSLREMLKQRQAEIEMLRHAIKHYQNQCDHPGQVTGYNERDGSWASPCPVCGESC